MQALSKMSSFQQQKITRHAKKQESVIHICKKKKQATKTAYENDQMLGITKKYFKVGIISMFIELKESLIKESKV